MDNKSKKQQVTIKTIADHLGLSFSTVAKALNNDPKVKEETKKLVKQTAKKLGYKPNYIAKSLRENTSRSIGIILNDVENPAMSFVFKRISLEMSKMNISTLICDSQYDPVTEERNINSIMSRMPDCMIIFPVSPFAERQDIFGDFKDRVIILGDSSCPNINSVSVDYGMGGYISAKEMLSAGHRDILVFAEPSTFPISNEYIEGIKKAFAEYGVPFDSKRVFHTQPSIENGFRLFMDQYDEKKKKFKLPFTGILCFCDTIAHGVYKGCRTLNLSIPNDISVIGFDDNPLSAYSNPPLSTIYLPKEKMLESCLSILKNKLENSETSIERYFIDPYYVKRKSVKKIEKE